MRPKILPRPRRGISGIVDAVLVMLQGLVMLTIILLVGLAALIEISFLYAVHAIGDTIKRALSRFRSARA